MRNKTLITAIDFDETVRMFRCSDINRFISQNRGNFTFQSKLEDLILLFVILDRFV